jgi:mannose-6-phosphate isomerase
LKGKAKKQMAEQKIYKLKGRIQHYAWGGFSFLPNLLHLNNNVQKPFAEYWLGTHPNASAEIELGDNNVQGLNQIISLPYLFKVLDVNEMLSIQLHPNKAQAEVGFAKENSLGIPLLAFNRNYKDDNHKPELVVALSEFWLLHGFRSAAKIATSLYSKKCFESFLPILESDGIEGLYKYLMNLNADEVEWILTDLKNEIRDDLINEKPTNKNNPDYWALKAIQQYGYKDKGIFSFYLMNLICLHEGEGVFQAANVPHAYLEGQNVELMSNSDNVLRGGLTPKHVDVEELLRLMSFESVEPSILLPQQIEEVNWTFYQTPINEFILQRLATSSALETNTIISTPSIFFVLNGSAILQTETETITLQKGESAFVQTGSLLQFQIASSSVLFWATNK